jgi:hypothetical protein
MNSRIAAMALLLAAGTAVAQAPKPQKNLNDPLKYIDESYYARAVR